MHLKKQVDDSFSGEKIVFVLDVSKSMNVSDVDGNTRLIAAKDMIYSILRKYEGYAFALTIFAGDSQRVLPFTHDISLVATFTAGLDSGNIIEQGTQIDRAISEALKSFYDDERGGNIIIITDGPEEVPDISGDMRAQLKEKEVDTYIVGVGSLRGGYVPTGDFFEPYKIYKGERVVSRLNKEVLEKISKEIGAMYSSYPQIPDINTNSDGGKEYAAHNWYLYVSIFFWFGFLFISFQEYYRKS